MDLDLTEAQRIILGDLIRLEKENLPQSYREGFVPEEVYGEEMTSEKYEEALDGLAEMFPDDRR